MLSKEELDKYIATIPPLPAVLRGFKMALISGDLTKAADLASTDRALLGYFKDIVNKPIFGFTSDIKDARQIFGVLGLLKVRQLFQSYLASLLSPNQWQVFKLNAVSFQELQASFIVRWEAILKAKNMNNEQMLAVVTLIPAAIAVCENVFKAHKDTVELIKAQKNISYEKLLQKLSGYSFFDLVRIIAKKWEFPSGILDLLSLMEKPQKTKANPQEEMMGYLALLINYEISRPIAIKSGINDLFELDFSYSEEMVEFFYKTMDKIESERIESETSS